MKNRIAAIISGMILFVIVVIIILIRNINLETVPDEYVDRGSSNLPIVSFRCLNTKTNPLIGYSNMDDSIASARTVLPNSKEYVEICFTESDNISNVSVFLQTLDRKRLLDEAEGSLYKKGGYDWCNYSISVMAEKKETYYLTVKVETKDNKTGYYTTKLYITDDKDIAGKQDLLSLANKFSDWTLNKQADQLSSYLDYDELKTGTDLSYVNLSTPAKLVTWAELEPRSGEKSLVIYEWGKTQIEISLCYKVTSVYDDESNEYNVKENFILRERDGKLFVLDYERYAGQIFDGRSDQMGYTSILLGVQKKGSMEAMTGDSKSDLFFVVDGGVWHYNVKEHRMTNIYGSRFENSIGGEYPYKIDLINFADSKLYFTVEGYIAAGINEGNVAFSLYEYDPANKTVKVKVELGITADVYEDKTLAYLTGDKLFTVALGGNLYSVDLTGTDIICIADNIDINKLYIDPSSNYIAWQAKGDDKNIYRMDLEESTIDKISGDTPIELFGFIRQDMVYGYLADGEWKYEGFLMGKLYESVHIIGADHTEKAHYKYDEGKLSNIKINSNNVTMALCEEQNGEWKAVKNDTLIMAGESDKDNGIIMVTSSEAKRNYYYITIPALQNKAEEYNLGEALYAASDIVSLDAGTDTTYHMYEGWSYGQRVYYGDVIQTAVKNVFDHFGTVRYRNDDSVVWNRDARELYLTMNLPKMVWTEEGHEEEMAAMSSLERAVDIFIHSGVMTGVISREQAEAEERKDTHSVYDELELVYGERLIDLGHSELSMLLYYINLRHPVLAITRDGAAYLLTGYTSNKIVYYNPADRSTNTLSMDDAVAFFGDRDAYYVCYD